MHTWQRELVRACVRALRPSVPALHAGVSMRQTYVGAASFHRCDLLLGCSVYLRVEDAGDVMLTIADEDGRPHWSAEVDEDGLAAMHSSRQLPPPAHAQTWVRALQDVLLAVHDAAPPTSEACRPLRPVGGI